MHDSSSVNWISTQHATLETDMGSTSKHSKYDFNVFNKIIKVPTLSAFYASCSGTRHTNTNRLKMVGLETNHNRVRQIGF